MIVKTSFALFPFSLGLHPRSSRVNPRASCSEFLHLHAALRSCSLNIHTLYRQLFLPRERPRNADVQFGASQRRHLGRLATLVLTIPRKSPGSLPVRPRKLQQKDLRGPSPFPSTIQRELEWFVAVRAGALPLNRVQPATFPWKGESLGPVSVLWRLHGGPSPEAPPQEVV